MCGLDLSITLFPHRYSPSFLPKHHSIPNSAFQFRACHCVGLLLYHLLQATLDSWTMTAPCGGDRRVHVACGPGYTSCSHASFLGQKRLCVHTTDNCSAWTERRYSWGRVTRLFTHRNQGLLSAQLLAVLCDFSLVVNTSRIQNIVSLKQPQIQLFKLGSSLLFVFIHQAVVRVVKAGIPVCAHCEAYTRT